MDRRRKLKIVVFFLLLLGISVITPIITNFENNGIFLIPNQVNYSLESKVTVNNGSEIPVNVYTANDQSRPDVAARSDGSFVVVWQSNLQDGSGNGVYAQLFDSTGNNLTNDILVNVETANNQGDPEVAVRPDGSFVVAYYSEGQDGDGGGIFTQIFDSNGNNLTNDILVNVNTTGAQGGPDVAARSDGSFVVVWFGPGTGDTNGVYAQIFDLNGNNLTNDILVNTETTNTQYFPSVATRQDNSFVVAWSSWLQDGSNGGVYAKLFDSNGINLTNEIPVNTFTSDTQDTPAVATRADGSFVVAWETTSQDTSGQAAYLRIFNANGVNLTNEIQANTYITDNQYNVDIGTRSDGSFVVVWGSDGQDGSGYGVYTKIFDTNGNNITNDISVNSYTLNAQDEGVVAIRPDNSFVIAWMSFGQDTSSGGIYAKIFWQPSTPTSPPVPGFGILLIFIAIITGVMITYMRKQKSIKLPN